MKTTWIFFFSMVMILKCFFLGLCFQRVKKIGARRPIIPLRVWREKWLPATNNLWMLSLQTWTLTFQEHHQFAGVSRRWIRLILEPCVQKQLKQQHPYILTYLRLARTNFHAKNWFKSLLSMTVRLSSFFSRKGLPP